ncbi:hypothetical protein LSAT2_017580 [Lamellibrachia satsuma]|nr:hypothetical protein LSAT2_017580 [Lamellibrachia satsuma]
MEKKNSRNINAVILQMGQQRPEPSEDPDEGGYENVTTPVSGGGSTVEVIHGANSQVWTLPSRAEWECLPGWHPLTDSRSSKHAIREVLSGHIHEDGCYILTPYKTPGNLVLIVTYKNATKNFLVKRTEPTGEQPTLFYIYEHIQACSVKKLIEHYTRHRLANAETEVYEAEEGRSDVDKRSAHEVVRQEALSIITETPSVVNRRIAVQWQLDW